MPDDANGNNSPAPGYKAVTGQKVLASQHNPPIEDLSSCMTARLMRDGRAPMLGPLNMNGYKAFGMGAGSENTDAATVGQIPALASAGIAAATEKVTPVDADTLPLTDSAASSALKKLTWANVKAALKAYFDALYQAVDTALLKTGGTMTGALILAANPTSNLGAAPKQYVDDALDSKASINSTTDSGITDFPIGTIIAALGSVNRNQTATVWLSTVNTAAFITTGGGAGAGTALAGTWRACGVQAGATSVLMQRVA